MERGARPGRVGIVSLGCPKNLVDTEVMLGELERRGYRIVEVPVSCRPRVGRSKVAGTVRGSILAGYHLLFTTVRYAWRR